MIKYGGYYWLNLTPHEVTIYDATGTKVLTRIPPSGFRAHLVEDTRVRGTLADIPIVEKRYGPVLVDNETPHEIIRKIERIPGVIIVSGLTLETAKETLSDFMTFVVAPDTGPQSAVRDEQGRIVGVKRLMVSG